MEDLRLHVVTPRGRSLTLRQQIGNLYTTYNAISSRLYTGLYIYTAVVKPSPLPVYNGYCSVTTGSRQDASYLCLDRRPTLSSYVARVESVGIHATDCCDSSIQREQV